MPLSDDSLRTDLEIVGDHLHLLVESSPEGMVICDDCNRIIFANPQFCSMFGWGRDEVTGKDIDEVVAGAEEVAAEASLVSSTVFSTPHMIPDAVRVRKDGKMINVSILAGPVLADGRTVGAYGIYRDISFKKKAEDDIRREKAFFENLFEKAPEAILLCGREARGIKVNRAFTELFGYTREDIEGEDVNLLLARDPELLREARGLDALSWSTWKPFSLDTWRTRKDGTRIPVGILQFPFKVDDENEVEYTIYRDRTSELRARAALRREKAFFENLFEACPDAIILSNREGQVLRANRAFYELFGYSKEDRIIGSDIFGIVARDPRNEKEARELEERFWSGEEIDREVVRQRKDGSDLHLHLTQVPFRLEEGSVVGYIIYRDIEHRKKAERETVRHLAFERLISSISSLFLSPGDIAEQAREAVSEIAAHIGATHAFVYVFTDGESVTPLARWTDPEIEPGNTPHINQPWTWLAKRIRKEPVVYVPDTSALPPEASEECFFALSLGWKSFVAYPIFAGECCRGFALFGNSLRQDPWRGPDAPSGKIFCNIIGQAFLRHDLEEARREPERFLNDILQFQTDFVVRIKPDFSVIFANRAFWEFLGVPEGLPRGTSLKDLMKEEDLEQACRRVKPLSRENPVSVSEEEMTGHDGAKQWIQWIDRGIFDVNGDLVEIQGVGRDISRLKRAQEALKESERKFLNIVEDQDEFIIRFQPDGTLTFANSSYCRRFGKKLEEILGECVFDHVDQAEATRLKREHFDRLTPENPTNTDESWSLLPDGQIRLEQWQNRGVFDQDGNLVTIQCVGRDITSQREAEQALRESERRYAAIVESQIEMVCRFNTEGKVTFVNDAFCLFFGLERENILSRPLSEVMGDPEASSTITCSDGLCLSDPASFFEHSLTLPPGKKRWLRWSRRGIFDEKGDLTEIQAVARDMTDIKRTEEELRHLNSILRSIRGVNRLISRHQDSERLVQEICAHLVETRGYRNVWIGILGKGGSLASVSEAGIGPDGRPLSERIRKGMLNEWGMSVLKEPGVHIKRGIITMTDCPLLDRYEETGIMATRLEFSGKIFGLISVSVTGESPIDPEEQLLFSELAEDISFALHVIGTEMDRREKAATLEEKARQLDLLVSAHPSGLWEWDVGEGRVAMNSAYETMLGYSPGEMGQSIETWKGQVHPDDLPRMMDLLNRILSGGDGENTYEVDFRMLKKEGTWLRIRSRGFVVRRDRNGRAARMVGIQTPIDQEHQEGQEEERP